MTTTARVTTYAGEEMPALKLAIFAEVDAFGRVFYKTEAQAADSRAAVSFICEKDEAIAEFAKLADRFLTEQTNKLNHDNIGD